MNKQLKERGRSVAEAKRVARDVFPAKIVQLHEMLNSPAMSVYRVDEVRADSIRSTALPTVSTADDGSAAQKRPRMSVPNIRILDEVTDKLSAF